MGNSNLAVAFAVDNDNEEPVTPPIDDARANLRMAEALLLPRRSPLGRGDRSPDAGGRRRRRAS